MNDDKAQKVNLADVNIYALCRYILSPSSLLESWLIMRGGRGARCEGQKYYTVKSTIQVRGSKVPRAGTSRPPLKALFDHFTSDLPTPAIPRFAYLPHHHTFAFRELFLQLLFQECALVKAKVRDGAEIGRTGWQVTDSCAGIPCDHLLQDTLLKNTILKTKNNLKHILLLETPCPSVVIINKCDKNLLIFILQTIFLL